MTHAPFHAHRVLADAALEARKTTGSLRRMTARTKFVGRLSYENQIREGDILADSGDTVVAVYDHIWDDKANERLELPYDTENGCGSDGVMVALEGRQVHGLVWLTGDVEVFRPTEH